MSALDNLLGPDWMVKANQFSYHGADHQLDTGGAVPETFNGTSGFLTHTKDTNTGEVTPGFLLFTDRGTNNFTFDAAGNATGGYKGNEAGITAGDIVRGAATIGVGMGLGALAAAGAAGGASAATATVASGSGGAVGSGLTLGEVSTGIKAVSSVAGIAGVLGGSKSGGNGGSAAVPTQNATRVSSGTNDGASPLAFGNGFDTAPLGLDSTQSDATAAALKANAATSSPAQVQQIAGTNSDESLMPIAYAIGAAAVVALILKGKKRG